MLRRSCLPLTILFMLSAFALSQEPLSLIDATKPMGGWSFGNGPEFPGAKGELKLADEMYRDKPTLALSGDFTGGGNYVQAAIDLPEVPLEVLAFWVNTPPELTQLTIRLVDGSDQCHQIRLRLSDKGGWQRIVLPVDDFFEKMGTPAALDIATQYEKWGGANDGRWHQPGKLLAILAPRYMSGKKGTILVSDVLYYPDTEKVTSVAKTISLVELLPLGEIEWGFNLGEEFRGAKGGLDPVKDQPEAGQNAMRLHADFTGGGAYVGMRRKFDHLNVEAFNAIHLKMKSETTKQFALRLVDGTGQCHQRKNLPFTADGKWQDVALIPTEIAGGEHWGGANDGKWHDPVQLMELMLNTRSADDNKPELLVADIRADVQVKAAVKAAAQAESFDEADGLPAGWEMAGTVGTDSPGHDSKKALKLSRTLDDLRNPTFAAGPAFAVHPGPWQVAYVWKADLHSPDNSYHGAVDLEVLDAGGRKLETVPVDIGFGKSDWKAVEKSVTLPKGAEQARFRIELKKTYGTFWLDDLSAAPLATKAIEQRVERILLATDAVGNLFEPGDPIVVHVTVEASKPLGKDPSLQYTVRDYWGALQTAPGELPLQTTPRDKGVFKYTAEIRLPDDAIAQGKYCELHVDVPQPTGEPANEYCGLAVLPIAPAKQCKPEDVPFTIRNWDSRIREYFFLSDRLGLRMMGIWGGWSEKPPYKPHAPGIDLCAELGAKWVTGTPAAQIERNGFEKYSEESLRQGMKNFLTEYADKGLAMIAMGNEPHGKGEKVLENVRAYRAIYEAVKAFDPNIHVIGTSVEPNEEYFKAGYQDYLDSYDFHIYEHYSNVRRTMHEYRDLMKKYGAVKPIHSTELGLNSQGQTRRAVAIEMIKKFTVFFAEGGDTVSWFTIQYPDPKGKARGQFGDSHCVFDCKYNLFNPRLDAVTYYHILNGICDKKFLGEVQHADGVQAYLFRNDAGKCLQVLWRDEGRKDVQVPLPAGKAVELVRLDGSSARLQSAGGGVTVTVCEEPILLLYDEAKETLAKSLGEPAMSLTAAPAAVRGGESTAFVVQGKGVSPASVRIDTPSLWKLQPAQLDKDRVQVTVQVPAITTAREGRVYVQLEGSAGAVANLTVDVPVAGDSPIVAD